MSFLTDFAEFLEEYDIDITTYTRTDGRSIASVTSSTINACIQPYSETSLNSNSTMRSKKFDGKDMTGTILIITDADLKIDSTDTFIYSDDSKYKIEQRMPYTKIYEHYEYLACLVKAQ